MSNAVALPAVSVILPCRDAARWLPGCIGSLERQTLPGFEVLAIDDRSVDTTSTLLQSWAAHDSRIRVLEAKDVGLVTALREAAGKARAAKIARMDADDIAHPDRLAAQSAFLDRHPDIAACGTGVRLFPRGELGSGYRRYEKWLNGLRTPEQIARDLFVECPIAHPTLMLRAADLETVGGYLHRGWPEDYDLILRLHAAGRRLANLPRVLLGWRVRRDRLSLCSPTYAPEAFRLCKVHYLVQELPEGRPPFVWGAGRVGKAFALALRRRGRGPTAFVDLDPRKIGQRIHDLPVLDRAGLEAQLSPMAARPYVLIAVGSPGAREEIREALAAFGMRETEDFRAVA